MFNSYPDVVSISDIQSMLNIGKSMVYKLLQENKIISVRAGKRIIIPKQSVINYLNSSTNHDIISEHGKLVILEGGKLN